MKSDRSMDNPVNFKGEFTADSRVQEDRAGSPVPSCLSMKSDRSMDNPVNFKGEFTADSRVQQSLEYGSFEETGSDKLSSAKKSLLLTLMKLKKDEKLKLFQSHLSQDCPECCLDDQFMKFINELFDSREVDDYPECIEREQEDPEAVCIVEKLLETCGSEGFLKITLHILRKMKQKELAEHSKSFLSLLLCVN
ncbi:uncharacterized protein LOC135246694 isoform X2 [Anguilla rostrata]|uniref:uncharacterized protein LOC135246694 isoform X2 n=1 Tax=Anguilla rostrata TaxID=7938 RepID=UPI0030CFD179